MATRKSASKAKTNTRKTTRTSNVASARTRSTRTSAAARPPAKKARTTTIKSAGVQAKRTVSSVGPMTRRLAELQRISAGIFILLAVLAGYFIRNISLNLTLGHLVRDDLATQAGTVFVPAVHGIYDINLRWVVVGIMVLSAVMPLLWTFRWRRQYEVNIEAEAMPQRWFDLAVTTALMVETIALLSGIHDLLTLKLVAGLMVLTCGLGWLADRENRQADKSRWSAYILGLVAGCLPWLLILGTAVATYVYGMIRSPWYVYALYGSTLLGFGLLAWNQRRHYRRANQWKFAVVERNYVLINLLTKTAFAVILIVGLHR